MATNRNLLTNINEKIHQLERKESRLLQELGTVSNRVDRKFPDTAFNDFVWASDRVKALINAEIEEIDDLIRQGVTNPAIRQKEAADYREKLIISIMDRLCGVQSDLLYLSSLRKSIV
ncbi:hypothetical protein PRIPAC_96466 [Pristionchus pacificus]|uniref:Uncharacterized protein n=1 Tax=Pristionchus pacificus TaxID=54126 RepID=A0A454Y6E1_PRIPA|nr:hypothetical protein PRIPAC_96466 [Pristionchus pacificus]|eukprot:PDM80530.1 hypothetical protein PRIPAC_35433 [Pristionchus pacificus]